MIKISQMKWNKKNILKAFSLFHKAYKRNKNEINKHNILAMNSIDFLLQRNRTSIRCNKLKNYLNKFGNFNRYLKKPKLLH